MDQVFAVRQMCEKYLANGKDVFWAFMDLVNGYRMMLVNGYRIMLDQDRAV